MNDDAGVAIIIDGDGGLVMVTAETLVDMGTDHVVQASQGGRAKDYEGKNLQERLGRLFELKDGGLVSVECCDAQAQHGR